MICNKCNHKLPDDSEFCQYCGSKIKKLEIDSNSNMTSEEALNIIAKIQAEATIDAMNANEILQPNNENDEDFGVVPEKPVFTLALKSVIGEEEYLKSLRTINCEPIKWSRCASISVDGVNGIIDVYDTYLPSGQFYKTIYINMYGANQSTKAPNGFVLMASAPKVTAIKVSKQKEPKVCKPKKPVNKKLVVCFMVIPIAIALVALLVVFVLMPGLKYNYAKKLLENGNYELAYSEFLALDGYSDSENMLLECRYVQAIKYRDAGDYELANKIFESLGNYRDSKILIHKHDYKVSNTVAATCTSVGSETYKCVNCEETYMKSIDKLAHTYSVVTSTDATCNATGSKTYKCSGCNHTYSETVTKLTHKYEVVASQDPTCQKEGYATHKCSLCSDEYTETKGKVSHDTILVSTTDSTCIAVGAKNYKCKNCTYTYSEEIAKKSHNYSDATCTAPKTCGMCGNTEGQKLGHTDTLVCTRCGDTTFETLVITGVGDTYISDFSIPSGTYNIKIEKKYSELYKSIYVKLNGHYIVDTYEAIYIEQVKISSYNNAILAIDCIVATEEWKITIEAVGN